MFLGSLPGIAIPAKAMILKARIGTQQTQSVNTMNKIRKAKLRSVLDKGV